MASVWKRGGEKNAKGIWQITFRDETGRSRTQSANTTDKATALQIAEKLESSTETERQTSNAANRKPTITELAEQLGLTLQRTPVKRWEPWEDEAVRTQSTIEAAKKTGRTVHAVYQRRFYLGVSVRATEAPALIERELPQVVSDPSLAMIVNAWSTLSPSVRESLTTMVKVLRGPLKASIEQ